MSGQLTPGGTITGNIIQGETGTYAVALAAGFSYEFDVLSNPQTGISPVVDLVSPGGGISVGNQYSSNGEAFLAYTPAVSGTYDLDVSGNNNVTGPYSIVESPRDDFTDNDQTTGTISPGGTLAGTLSAAYDVDWFRVSLKAGFAYEFDVFSNPTTSAIYPTIQLLSYGNEASVSGVAYTNNGEALLGYTPAIGATGTYYLVIKQSPYAPNTAATGTYTLVEKPQGDFTDNASTSGIITIGGTTTGTLEAAYETDWLAVNLTAGLTYNINVISNPTTGFFPTEELLTAGGAVAVSTQYSSNGVGTLNYKPTTSGTYYLAISQSPYANDTATTGPYQVVVGASQGSALDAGSGTVALTMPSGAIYLDTEGANTITAGAGTPTINAASGNPLIFGGPSALNFIGGKGAATVVGGSAGNTVTGGSGTLVLFGVSATRFTPGTGSATIVGGGGTQRHSRHSGRRDLRRRRRDQLYYQHQHRSAVGAGGRRRG